MIVAAGESLIDIVVGPDGSSEEAVGGSLFTTALGLARLEVPCVLMTALGDDARGDRIRSYAAAAGLEVEAGPLPRTATATAHLDAAGVATYDFDIDWSLPAMELPACDALHVGALGTLLEPGRDSVWDLVDQAYARAVPVTYDPNIRDAFVDNPDQVWRDVEALANRSTVVKLSDADVALLHPGADPADIARSLLDGERTELVVLTLGADGATAFAPGVEVAVPAPATPVVDTVGAGDCFAAAMLTVLFESGSLGEHGSGIPADRARLTRLLDAAVIAASLNCARRGASPPTRSELPVGWPD